MAGDLITSYAIGFVGPIRSLGSLKPSQSFVDDTIFIDCWSFLSLKLEYYSNVTDLSSFL